METKEIFVVQCTNNKNDKATLDKHILDNVAQGTKIITDGWAAYQKLNTIGFEWDWVNHSNEFVK